MKRDFPDGFFRRIAHSVKSRFFSVLGVRHQKIGAGYELRTGDLQPRGVEGL